MLFFQIGKFSNWKSLFTSREGRDIDMFVEDKKASAVLTIDEDGDGFFDREWPKHNLTEEELRGLSLKKVRTQQIAYMDKSAVWSVIIWSQLGFYTLKYAVSRLHGQFWLDKKRGPYN